MSSAYALELRDLRKSFGKTEIIRGANLAVTAGERVAIIGPNGAGKSTLFNLISGRFEPTSGDVLLERPYPGHAVLTQPGQPSHDLSLPRRSLRECLAEELRRLDPDLLYGRVITEGLALLHEPTT